MVPAHGPPATHHRVGPGRGVRLHLHVFIVGHTAYGFADDDRAVVHELAHVDAHGNHLPVGRVQLAQHSGGLSGRVGIGPVHELDQPAPQRGIEFAVSGRLLLLRLLLLCCHENTLHSFPSGTNSPWISSSRNKAPLASLNWHRYSCWYHQSPYSRRCAATLSRSARGHCVTGISWYSQFSRTRSRYACHHQPRLPNGVDKAIRRPPETANTGAMSAICSSGTWLASSTRSRSAV